MFNQFEITTAQQLTAYVRALRKLRGLTQADVARLLGVSTMRVAAIEKDVGRLSARSLIGLLQLLDAHLELQPHPVAPDPPAIDADTPYLEADTADDATRTRRRQLAGEW